MMGKTLLLFALTTLLGVVLFSCKENTMIYESVDEYPSYQGNDLGLTYSKNGSTFKLWSPEAEAAQLHLYEDGVLGTPITTREMNKGVSGIWSVSVNKDLAGKFYTYQIKSNGGWLKETPGPYAKATGVNGNRGYVLDLVSTDPENWQNDTRPHLGSFNDIIIYELHLRDISIDPNSGIQFKGKFLGLTETGTRSKEGETTGIDHLKELGVTHVHILPMFDFRSIDETKLDDNPYNWGYEPQNFNVPEGSYSTDPYDPVKRIKELKLMVQALHSNGIRVIMDVVYNHTGFGESSEGNFSLATPGYYYRFNADGTPSNASACGNETASERPMMRKYMIASVDYWTKEYHMDGFRFDLMGIHDVQTMNEVSAHLQNIDPTIFVYGEGWKAGSSPLDDDRLALKKNVPNLKSIAAFSDEIRDGLKGSWHDWKAPGFVSGNKSRREGVKFGIVGGTKHDQINNLEVQESEASWAPKPSQCIVYVSCHDNHTLYDKLKIVNPDASEEVIIKQHILANTIVLTSQGVPFLHAGVDFLRTKMGVENSYNSPDSINMIDWSRKAEYKEIFEYYRKLIQMRKTHPVFHMESQQQINKNLKFIDIHESNVIAYQLQGNAVNDRWHNVLVIFNGEPKMHTLAVPPAKWKTVLEGMDFSKGTEDEIDVEIIDQVHIPAYSAKILIAK